MSESRNPRDPEQATGDPFLDAVAGLECLGRRLDALVDPAAARPAGAIAASLEDPWVEPLDALLGLMSLRHTLRLVIAGMCGELAECAVRPGAAWRRDLLR